MYVCFFLGRSLTRCALRLYLGRPSETNGQPIPFIFFLSFLFFLMIMYAAYFHQSGDTLCVSPRGEDKRRSWQGRKKRAELTPRRMRYSTNQPPWSKARLTRWQKQIFFFLLYTKAKPRVKREERFQLGDRAQLLHPSCTKTVLYTSNYIYMGWYIFQRGTSKYGRPPKRTPKFFFSIEMPAF